MPFLPPTNRVKALKDVKYLIFIVILMFIVMYQYTLLQSVGDLICYFFIHRHGKEEHEMHIAACIGDADSDMVW